MIMAPVRTYNFTPRGAGAPLTFDAASASGLAFLESELEKRDTTLREPLTSFNYPRDIPIEAGGGWVDTISSMYVDYGKSGGSGMGGVQGGSANATPVIQADLSKDLYKAHVYEVVMKIKYVDMQRGAITGRSIEQIYDDGIRLDFDKHMDLNTYLGYPLLGTIGLTNNPKVTASAVAATGAGGSTLWSAKTPEQILEDINMAIVTAWAAAEYDNGALINHILLDPENFTRLATSKVGTYNDKTILQFLMENNIAKTKGGSLEIVESRFCAGAGAGGTNRMILYRNDKKFIGMDLLVPLSRIMTSPNTEDGTYDSRYAGNVGEVKVHYYQTILYRDGI
jgi:hypothetical protein